MCPLDMSINSLISPSLTKGVRTVELPYRQYICIHTHIYIYICMRTSRSMVVLLSLYGAGSKWPPVHKVKEQVPEKRSRGPKKLSEYISLLLYS